MFLRRLLTEKNGKYADFWSCGLYHFVFLPPDENGPCIFEIITKHKYQLLKSQKLCFKKSEISDQNLRSRFIPV